MTGSATFGREFDTDCANSEESTALITSEVTGKQQRTEPRRFFKKSSSLPLVLTALLLTASSPHCLLW